MGRSFEVLAPVAGFVPGDTAEEEQLAGCNVDALVAGGLLRDTAVSDPLPPLETPPPVEESELTTPPPATSTET